MVRLAVGATLMVVSAYIGVSIDKYYKARVEHLSDYLEFLFFASREVGYLKTDLMQIISLYCVDNDSSLTKYLSRTAEQLKSGFAVQIDDVYFNKADKRAYCGFFAAIVNADFQAQGKVFARYIAETENLLSEAKKQKKHKGELIRKLSALGGVALMVLIV